MSGRGPVRLNPLGLAICRCHRININININANAKRLERE